MNEEHLIERVQQGGVGDRGAAVRAILAVVHSFSECLTSSEAEAFARGLPARIADRARLSTERESFFGAEDLYELVRLRAQVSPGKAREEAQVVLLAIGELLDADLQARLMRTLPEELGSLLRPREVGPPPEHLARGYAPPLTTLASGKPGSRHPLSEARPDRAQSHSVVREDNPHGETKLSSARGLTQERLGDAIATAGHAGSDRPISEARDDARAQRATQPDEEE